MTATPVRQLGLIAATALVMGNMIGSGVFLLPASLAPYGWNAVGGWIVTIAGALVLAWVLARLTRALPHAGGPTGFVEAAFGELPAFLIGWSYLVSIWTTVVAIAVAAVSYLSSFIPALGAGAFRPALAALVLLWAMTLINLRGARVAGGFQIVTLAIKVVPLVVVIVLAAGLLAGGTGTIAPYEPAKISLGAVNGAATLTLWALLGFECASLAAARVTNPEVNVPRATMWGTGLTGVLYLLVCSAIALMLPAEVAASSPAPFATFVERYWAAGPAAAVALFAVVSCVGALNGWILLQGEMPRDMAARGMLPRSPACSCCSTAAARCRACSSSCCCSPPRPRCGSTSPSRLPRSSSGWRGCSRCSARPIRCGRCGAPGSTRARSASCSWPPVSRSGGGCAARPRQSGDQASSRSSHISARRSASSGENGAGPMLSSSHSPSISAVSATAASRGSARSGSTSWISTSSPVRKSP